MTALQAAVRLLGAGERSASELRARLARKGFTPSVIEAAVERTRELGFLNDQRCAELKAARLFERGWSRGFVEARLQAAGIAPAAIQEVLAGAPDDRALARTALRSRYRTRLLSPTRAARWLAGRGFSPELIRSLLELSEAEER